MEEILSSEYLKMFLKAHLLFLAIFLIISILDIYGRKIGCNKLKELKCAHIKRFEKSNKISK